MIDPKKLDFNQIPKKFCDGAVGAHGKELFFLALTSGQSFDSYATTPQIMKSIALWATAQVESYEKQFGKIDMTPPSIQSPLQIADLNNSNSDTK